MVTKSQVLNYQPMHFSEAAEHFGATGAAWEAASVTQHIQAQSLSWEGAAAAAYRAVSAADHATIMAAAEQADAAAQLAAAHGVIVWQAKQEAVYAIEDADAAGFDVAEADVENPQLSDRLPTPRQYRQERQAEMMLHAQNIGATVDNLISQDRMAAAAMHTAGDFSRYQTGTNGHIAAVDNHSGPGGLGFDRDPLTGDPIGNPPGKAPEGKAWWYHPGIGWKQDDALQQCDGNSVAADALSVLGLLLPPTFPGTILADANAIRAIEQINGCEGP